MFVVDNFAIFFKVLILLSIALTILASMRFVGRAPVSRRGSTTRSSSSRASGMLFMVSGNNLISIYVALELMALSSYILAGYFKGEIKSHRGGAQVLRARRVLLGRAPLRALARLRRRREDGPAGARASCSRRRSGRTCSSLGILLVLAGLLFKIAAVPFHVWTPDVYEGSPTPVTAFFSVGPEARRVRDPRAHLLRGAFRSSTRTGG